MKKAFVPILLFFLFGFSPREFVPSDQNAIYNIAALHSFYTQLSAIQKDTSRVSIVHIGDSHIQSDFFSGEVRKKMQHTFGNAGRGFVFPYEIAGSGGALDVLFSHTGSWQACQIKKNYADCTTGLAGFTVIPSENSSFTIDVATKAQTEASFTKITFLDTSSSFLPQNISGHFFLHKEQENRVILFEKSQDRVTFVPAPTNGNFPALQGLVLENDHPGILYHALGINGSTVAQYLRSTRFENQIAALNTSLVIVSFGTNDSYSSTSSFCASCLTDDYRNLIARIRRLNPNVAILLTTPPDHHYRRKYHNKNVAPLRQAMLQLAIELDVAVWDLYEAMGGKNSILQWKKENLAHADLIHFTIPGYIKQGDMLYEALMQGYPKYE